MKGYIYKIYDNTNENIYYGSTKEKVSQRLSKHRYDYKRWTKDNNFRYCKSYEILKNDDYAYCVVEEFEYSAIWELRARERYYIENFKCVNKLNSYLTQDEKKEYNKNYNLLYSKEYRENNKEKIKEYRENNKEILSEKKKIYREKNKEIISLKGKEKIICECGCEVVKKCISRHKKSNKHFNMLNYQ